MFSAVATARNSIRKTWAKRRRGSKKEKKRQRERWREREKDEKEEKSRRAEKKKIEKKSHEGGMREAYDLKKKRRRKGRERKKSRTSGRLKSSNLFSAIGTLVLLTDPRAIYNTSTIKMRKLYKMIYSFPK